MRPLLWTAQDGRCACCARLLISHFRDPRSGDRDTIDHVWPKGAGGPDKLGNLALLTYKCNQTKGQRLPGKALFGRLQEINARLGWPTPEFWF